jgi:hypothetical protein
MRTYVQVETFLTSALDGGQWSASRPAALAPRREAPVPIGMEAGWAPDPVWTLWSREESLIPAGNQTPPVQPLARRHTD